jgi:hypothetical protein
MGGNVQPFYIICQQMLHPWQQLISVPLTFYTHAGLRCHRVAIARADDSCNVHTMQASYQQPTTIALQDECVA